MYYAKACNEFAGLIFASLRPGNTAPFEEMLQRWRAVGNNVFSLTSLRFEPKISHFRHESVTTRPTGRYLNHFNNQNSSKIGVYNRSQPPTKKSEVR